MIDKFKVVVLVLLGSIFLVVMINMGLELNRAFHVEQRGISGLYNRGIITIRANTIQTHEDLIFIANHEWAHHVMNKHFEKGDLLAWKKAVEKCGVNSSYAQTYKTKSVRTEEEWADSYALYYAKNVTLCPEKLAVIKKYV